MGEVPHPDDLDLCEYDRERCRDMDGGRPHYPPPGDPAGDVAAASAGYVFNFLGDLAKLPAPEAFRRLETYFLGCIHAYRDARTGWPVATPSAN